MSAHAPMARPRGTGTNPVVAGVVLGMSNTMRARLTAATLAITAAFALSGCAGAVSLLNSGDTETSTSTSTAASTPTPAAVPTLPTKEPAPAPTSGNVAEPSDQLASDIATIAGDALGFWEAMTHASIPADMAEYQGTGCSHAVSAASVCGTSTLYWNRAGLTAERRDGGDLALALTLSHEVGHLVMGATGNSTNDPKEERRAWCMAGVYLSVSKLDLGMTPDVLWKRAVPAVTAGRSAEETSVIRDRIDTGFRAQGDDPLAWCLTNA